jgi:hypothetical protein
MRQPAAVEENDPQGIAYLNQGEDSLPAQGGRPEKRRDPRHRVSEPGLRHHLPQVSPQQIRQRRRLIKAQNPGQPELQRRRRYLVPGAADDIVQAQCAEAGNLERVDAFGMQVLDKLLRHHGSAIEQAPHLRGIFQERHPGTHDHGGLG